MAVVPLSEEELASLNARFHQLWGQAHDSPDYDKKKWQEFEILLERLKSTYCDAMKIDKNKPGILKPTGLPWYPGLMEGERTP